MRPFVGSGAARRVRAGLLVAVVLGLAGAAAGHTYGRAADRSHEAEAVVLVHPSEGNPFSPAGGDDLVNLNTEAELVRADAVAVAVVRDESGVAPEQVLAGVRTEVPPNTQLIRITVVHRDPSVAVSRAQAFAEAYLGYRATRTTSALFDRSAHLAEQERAAEDRLAARFDQLSGLGPNNPIRSRVAQDIDVLTAQLVQLRTEQAAFKSAATEPGEVITPAALVGVGPVPATVWATAAGGLLGVVVAGGVAAARARRRDVVEDVGDLDVAGHVVLGTPDRLTDLRARLLVAAPSRPLVCLLAGTGSRGPSRAVATDFALCLGRARWETIHLDLSATERVDAAAPRADGVGLVDVLRDRATVDDALVPLGPHLHRLPLGLAAVGDDLQDLVDAPGLGAVVDELRKRADIVLVTGADLTDPSAQPILGHVDAVMLWVIRRQATLRGLRSCEDLVRAAGAVPSGVVYDEARPPSRRGRQ